VVNRLKDVWAQDKTAFGAWIMLSGPAGAEMIAAMGFDYIGIDVQHGLLAYEGMRDILMMLSGMPVTPIVRVPANDASWIGKALDAGAQGVIVPMVNSREEAERAVAACRFAPEGERSFGLARGRQELGRNPQEVNRDVLCLPMIETIEAVEAADAICSTPGVDGIYVGPNDLSLSMGLSAMGEQPPEHAEAIARVLKVCQANSTIPAIQAFSGAEAKQRAEQGFRMVTVTADAAILAVGAISELGHARG
jgi:4-hydroxy-2-oxoheptanedioate aldolase